MTAREGTRGRRWPRAAVLGLAALCASTLTAQAAGTIMAPEVYVSVAAGNVLSPQGPGQAWAVALTATPPVAQVGQPVTLTATANQNTAPYGLFIEVYDEDLNLLMCAVAGPSCSATVTQPTMGTHTYVAYISPDASSGQPPDYRARSNEMPVTWGAVPQPVSSGDPSDSCTSPLLTAIDGYVDGAYVRLLVQPSGLNSIICFRIAAAGTHYGGDIVVNAPNPALQPPGADNDDTACSLNPGGNLLPISQPISPLGIPGHLSTYFDYSTAQVCLTFSSLHAHVTVPVTRGSQAPQVNLDSPAVTSPAPVQAPPGQPSTQCQANGGTMLFDAASAAGTQAWVSAWQDTAGGRLVLCTRVDGVVNRGGALSVSTSPTLPDPKLTVSHDASQCSFPVLDVGAVVVTASQPGSDPVMLCITVDSTNTFSVSVSQGVGQPPATWALDS